MRGIFASKGHLVQMHTSVLCKRGSECLQKVLFCSVNIDILTYKSIYGVSELRIYVRTYGELPGDLLRPALCKPSTWDGSGASSGMYVSKGHHSVMLCMCTCFCSCRITCQKIMTLPNY